MTRYRRIFFMILSIGIMAAIFLFSDQPGDKSMQISESVTESLQLGKTDGSHSYSSVQPILFSLSARKYAHIVLYAALGLGVFLCFLGCKWKMGRKAIFTFLICFLYACSDELHQYFVPGRTASFTDILIDSIGFGSMIIFICLIRYFYR